MRLDSFLVAARLFKRRSLAKAACEAGAVRVAGRPAKASRKVRPGDLLQIDYSSTRLTIEVAEMPTGAVRREEASKLYVLKSKEARREDLLEQTGLSS